MSRIQKVQLSLTGSDRAGIPRQRYPAKRVPVSTNFSTGKSCDHLPMIRVLRIRTVNRSLGNHTAARAPMVAKAAST